MAKKDLSKIDLAIEEAKKKVASLENERRLVEENFQKQIGKLYVQLQRKKDNQLTYEQIQSYLKKELSHSKKEDKEFSKMEEEIRLGDKKTQDEEQSFR